MCDCYLGKCKVCGISVPIHLGDYATDRNEIDVFCHGHIPKENVRIFTLKKRNTSFKKGYKIGIRSLTDNARKNKFMNEPNLGVDFTITDVE